MEVISETIRKIFKNNKIIKSWNRNMLIDMRYQFIENFDKMYRVNFNSIILKQNPKNFLAIQFLQYCFVFDDREDKLVFCRKFINRLEIDKEGFFIDNPEAKDGLLILFKIEWDSLRKAINKNQFHSEFIDRLTKIEENTDVISELQKEIKFLVNRTVANKRKGRRKPEPLKYDKIFVENKEYGKKVKLLLEKNGYLDKDGMWIGESGKRNELAVLFYLLKKPKHNICIIKNTDNKNAIIAFYKEFGLKVSVQGEKGGYCVYNNISQESLALETRAKFKLIFTPQALEKE